MSRESVLLRGQVWELDQTSRLGSSGLPIAVSVRGISPRGDAAETFSVVNGRATWQSKLDAGSATVSTPAFYLTAGGTRLASQQLLLEALLAAPGRSLPLLPSGRAHAERLTEITVAGAEDKRTVVAWIINGVANTPLPVWSTQEGQFFGSIGQLAILPTGYEASLESLRQAQEDALAVHSRPLAARLLKQSTAGPVAFVNVRAFVDGRDFLRDQTVVIDDGRIVSIGPSRTTSPPPGARIIDGSRATLIPGLWDAHMHVSEDATGVLLLSLGITSIRDPGSAIAPTLARAARRARDEVLGPTVYPSVLIDGSGPYSSQSGTIVSSQQAALAAVRQAKEDRFAGIKLYGSVSPSWVAPLAAEAHRLGLHVHGHVPAGMRPSQAIAAGFDELTHIYFVMMEALPDEVVATSNGINRFSGNARYAKDVDLDSVSIRSLIDAMVKRGTVADPTLVVAESLIVPEPGELSPAYAPYLGIVPPVTERQFRQGGFAVAAGLTRDDYRRSFVKLRQLVGRLHAAGVPIVAGTDGTGMELARELELYVDAGLTPAQALASATIVPARVVGVDEQTGSIAVGKTADLVLVDGDPSQQIGDIRNTRWVMLGGRLFDADALRAASDFTGRPK